MCLIHVKELKMSCLNILCCLLSLSTDSIICQMAIICTKKDNIWIYTSRIHVATLHKPPITRVLFWKWSLKIDQVQNKIRTLKEKCTSYLVGSERSYLCWQKKVKIYTAALGARTINITSSFFKLKLIFSSQITCQHQHIISSLSSALRHGDSLERKRKNYRNE